MELSTLITIFHLLGIAIGMGGAFASDLIFLTSIRDKKITSTEFRFITLGGRMVWTGLLILFISGSILFSFDPDRFIHSPKFQTKITILSIIVLNGLVFHSVHIPRIKRHREEHLPSSDEFMRNRTLLTASGALSITSWISVLVLGAWRGFPFSYIQGVLGYVALAICAVTISYITKHLVLPHHKK
ncbi:MAG: hypothetical protein RJA61_709 [Candidatus Parcubacteria bacterium]|jgi:ABC-type xylose transport system permease subunit